ncbi:MAG TPA: hypothetical protein VNW30_07820 [Opitutaceae bacterium]|jgi:hypothetical protein|nr:hypothetical protein [Opitutaceae bacterium]
MKPTLLFFGLLCLVLSGCDSVSEQLRAPFVAPQPKSRVFAADERTTYAAARAALDEMGFGFVRGGPAQGVIEALSSVQTGGEGSMNGGRQLQVEAHFSSAADGGTQVDVVMHELVQSDLNQHPGMGTSTLLRDSPAYEEFLGAIGRHLAAHK